MDRNILDEVINDNFEDSEDLTDFDSSGIVVYARDWTIETIYNQIEQGNIDLNPKFQRRNAWQDIRRSKLIESIIMGYPIPEIVLAEEPGKKRSFIVIDGKQRLLSIAGFMNNEKYKYWDNQKLQKLKVCKDLNGYSYNDLPNETKREFDNSSLRCTVITNYNNTQVLYDIFYRLNSGSVPLSTQELRQVLNKGEFGDYLLDITNTVQPLHNVMGLDKPDMRLKDIEIILRIMSFKLFPKKYRSNLKIFLDDSMGEITKQWDSYKKEIETIYEKINQSIGLLENVFGDVKHVGRKYKNNKYETRFNKVLLEVEVYYFMQLDFSITDKKEEFNTAFKNLCINDAEFLSSIESSTKNLENYKKRYSKFAELVNMTFDVHLQNPFED